MGIARRTHIKFQFKHPHKRGSLSSKGGGFYPLKKTERRFLSFTRVKSVRVEDEKQKGALRVFAIVCSARSFS